MSSLATNVSSCDIGHVPKQRNNCNFNTTNNLTTLKKFNWNIQSIKNNYFFLLDANKHRF